MPEVIVDDYRWPAIVRAERIFGPMTSFRGTQASAPVSMG